MVRTTTKVELIAAVHKQWDTLWKMIDALPGGAESVVFDFGDDSKLKESHWKRDKNMRDVLIHLYEWHQLLLNWVEANLGCTKPLRLGDKKDKAASEKKLIEGATCYDQA